MVGKKLVALALVLSFAAVVSPKTAWADDTDTLMPIESDAPAAEAEREHGRSHSGSQSPSMQLGVGPGFMKVANGASLFGVNFSFAARVSHDVPLYLGIESGYYYSSTSAYPSWYAPGSSWSIPIMPTAYYRFEMGNSCLHPFLGASAGIAVVGGNISLNLPPTNYSYYNNSVYFQAMARPGLDIDIAPSVSLSLEPRFGIMTYSSNYSATIFNPVMHFNFGF